ncbi:L-aspartate oxidase [Adhaeribacter sp. BT258]|uniref:L-aspartate oxidase n=1 Tax=Adhaeribacter terrigena TaxID=2793070 RepID=A0ABS1BZ40_9BACT|nr:L-aspartate oxidase [Adhaeribacter terrigena]MBK0402384.1 L-aspartate oxidase [Adhaeribacter terrigena]
MLSYDFLVIGSGIGGLGFALKVAKLGTVGVICKGKADQTNTSFAQGGLSAVTDPKDTFEIHVADTLTAGAGMCDEEMVRLLAEKAPLCIQELQELGVNFTRNAQGALDLGREGGHSHHRIVHTHDYTGLSIQEALLKAVKTHPNITLLEDHFAVDLLLSENNEGEKKCIGVQTFSTEKDTVFPVYAKAVMLATGGAGQVYQHTTNPVIATGDGLAMAYRAGAKLKDLEFVQFHPTSLYDPGKPTFLISEAVRGFGAKLVNEDGIAFMNNYHALGSLAPRDVVSRAIQKEMQKADAACVYLDLRPLPSEEIPVRFPKIFARCLESGLDMRADLIPVVPAAHFMCGGVKTDASGQTSIPGLYACGEVACTGVHGANRLASNSLPEGWIFGRRAAEAALLTLKSIAFSDLKPEETTTNSVQLPVFPNQKVQRKKAGIQELMWTYVGIVRTVPGLLLCREKLEQLLSETTQLKQQFAFSVPLQELQNLAQVGLLITEAALHRTESVGCHFIEVETKSNSKAASVSFIINRFKKPFEKTFIKNPTGTFSAGKHSVFSLKT